MQHTQLEAATGKTLAQWLDFISQQHHHDIDMGLARIRSVFARLQLDFSGRETIVVTGTNGKGSTSAVIEHIGMALDKTVGVYSSPHLLDYRERVRINGNMLPEALHCQAFQVVEAARGDTPLTLFEFGTLAALVLLEQHGCELLILEVGLGGDTDAVNIVDADLAIITSIGIDHSEWLGNTRESVARHKSGIFRQGKKAVVGEPNPPENLRQIAIEMGLDCLWQGEDFSLQASAGGWRCHLPGGQYASFQNSPLLAQNIATALAACWQLSWPIGSVGLNALLAKITLPGRYQTLQLAPKVILDVGHNPQATQSLAQRLADEPAGRLHLVVAMLKDKDIEAGLAPFFGLSAKWYLAGLDCARGAPVQMLTSALRPAGQDYRTYSDPTSAYKAALQAAQKQDCILVFGSFVTAAEIVSLVSE